MKARDRCVVGLTGFFVLVPFVVGFAPTWAAGVPLSGTAARSPAGALVVLQTDPTTTTTTEVPTTTVPPTTTTTTIPPEWSCELNGVTDPDVGVRVGCEAVRQATNTRSTVTTGLWLILVALGIVVVLLAARR